jgi:hypothetical protein
MTQTVSRTPPRLGDVLREQVRATGVALRWPAGAAAVLMALATVLVAAESIASGGAVDFRPELSMLPGMAGLLLPIAVWWREERFGDAFLWTLPVDRRTHALAKAFAGWAWLMGAVALFVLWLAALTVLTGGSFLAEETLRLLPSPVLPSPGGLDPAALRSVRWAPEPLFWLVPFTAATGAYLLTSALALGTRHPVRWLAGLVLALLLVNAAGVAVKAEWLAEAPGRLWLWFFEGRYGLDALLTARAESLKTMATLSTGETVSVWRGLPDPRQWAVATASWTLAGLVALWAAASRHRERRRA